ncbi:hypothetical protein F4804DRAFT_333932 [Jackrogersella minutella]|nr:hypothetical protein F4804DRAFT_333932 [Jackrogersella minutella]
MVISKRTTFTTISLLPPGIAREVVIAFLHNHVEMIDLNPLVIERHQIAPPAHAPAEERRCVWWSMTDKISYLPGGVVSGDVTYTAAFNDLPNGVQTHSYAPMGTDIRGRWSLNGTLPGEPPEPVELGIGAPRQGLYLREDVELRCNFVMSSFVKKTLKKAHSTLVDRLLANATAAAKNQSARVSHQHTGSSSHSGSAHSSFSAPPPRSSHSAAPYPQHSRAGSGPPPPRSSYAHNPTLGLGADSAVPEPLRVSRIRTPSAQLYHQGLEAVPHQQHPQNGRWSGEKPGFGHPPAARQDTGGGFRAELE